MNRRFLILLMILLPLSVNAKLSDKELAAAAVLVNAANHKAAEKNSGEKETEENADKNTEAASKTDSTEEKNSEAENGDGPIKKLNLATIDVSGVDSELKKNIELHMPVTIPECRASKADIRLFFTTVKKHLRKASRALGYYDANFRSGGKVVKNCWKLRLRITPGLPTKIVKQTIKVVGEGSKDELFQKILAKPPYKKGDIFNHKQYTDFKTQLSDATQSLGYFDAEFKQHSIKVNPLARQASVSLLLDTGKRYRYGAITVDQKVLSDTTINNFLLLKTGGLYKTEDLIKQQQLLQRSGYYQLIKVEARQEDAKDYRIPVVITLTSKKRNAYKYKVGYGSDTGVRVSAEMNRRWTGPNGKQLKAKIQYAQNLSGLSLKLVDPQKKPEDDTLVYNFDWKQDKSDDITSQSIDFGGKYTRKLSNDWIQSASIGLLLDKTQVDGGKSNRTNLLLFGVGLDKTKADNLLYPTDGWRFKIGAKGALKGLISDQSVLQLESSIKRIIHFDKGRFIGRLHLGTTQVNHFDDLPKSLRFFAGGGRSVRGYSYQSLGEVDKNEQVIGGKHVLDLSLEYQHPITDTWSAAVFVDAGNAFNKINHAKLKVGMGVGARWRSPIGPVRIDVGFPKDDITRPQLHLSVGSDL